MTSPTLSLFRRTIKTACTVTVLHNEETLEAHVELDDDLLPQAGDHITVLGAPVCVAYGETLTIRRDATLVRGALFDKAWARIKAAFLMTELFEVSFSDGRF